MHNAFLAKLSQPARIPQLQHSTLKVKQEEINETSYLLSSKKRSST